MPNPYLIEIDYVYGPEDRERIRRFILPDYCSLNKQKPEVYYLTIRRSGGTTCRENRMFRKIFQGKEMGSLEEVTAGFLALCRNVESGVFEDVFKLEIDPKAKSLKIPMHRSHMERAFFHLLDRGIKQNRDGGTLSVSIEQMHEGKRPLVAITFRDEGEGKPSPSSEGFGLALVEHLIRAHGGKVLLKKTKGGSDLTVSLPLD